MNTASEKVITYRPSLSMYSGRLALSVILTPVFGIGLLLFWLTNRRHRKYLYSISDTSVSVVTPESESALKLRQIDAIQILNHKHFGNFNTQTLRLIAGEFHLDLAYLPSDSPLPKAFHLIVDQNQKLNAQEALRKDIEPKYYPGSLEKLNDLVGLWQQGLISQEDFETERKKYDIP